MQSPLSFSLVKDKDEAKKLWNELSPNKVIDDEWNFRYVFAKPLDFDLHFIAGYDGKTPVGLLPLQVNSGKGLPPPYAKSDPFLEFFGGDDTDDNQVLIKKGYEGTIPQFLRQIQSQAVLAPLATKPLDMNSDFYENKYYLPLLSYKNHQDYIEDKWKGDNKRNLKRQLRKLFEEHTITHEHNSYNDIELLFEFNRKRFGEDSSFNLPYRKQIFRDLINLYRAETLSIIIDGKKEAVSYGIIYKNIYLDMNTGYNPEISNLGKLLTLLQIDRAIELGCTIFDAGKGDSGWKEMFHFEKSPQFKVEISN